MGSREAQYILLVLLSLEATKFTMVSEETPLLTPQLTTDASFDHATIYDRFSARQKTTILAIVSWCGLMPREF
jgi:ABC-type uncharacterized transport system permease subunit